MYTLNEIRAMYDRDVYEGVIDEDFTCFLRENFTPIYDAEFNFLGWERR